AATPLREKGIGQAKTLHTLLRHALFDLVLCSELERAPHTARLVLEGRATPLHILPVLNELYFGDWVMRHHRVLTHED
ncbi:histidine phosphatase family protein, partial [Salmonella enterica]|uniref:histidine phosphatase family protein n=1 Tax=Salmonella enterica TaxID=28901 RepID=UPI00329A3D53